MNTIDVVDAVNRGWSSMTNHLWQATVFSVLVFVASVALRRGSAKARYLVWVTASAKFLLPSAFLVLILNCVGLQVSSFFSPAVTVSPAFQSLSPVIYPVSVPTAGSVSLKAAPPPDSISSSAFPGSTKRSLLVPALTMLWLGGCIAFFSRWWLLRRRLCQALRSGSFVYSGREWNILREVRSWLQIRREVGLLVSVAVSEPGVWRSFRPVVVLPAGIADHLSDDELEAVMLHEMAHVLRWDNLISNLQMALCCVFWFHPLVWLIDRRLLEERELACDEMVISFNGETQLYASTIRKIYKFCLGWRVTGLSAVAGSNIKKRLELILSPVSRSRISLAQRVVVTIVILVAIGLVAVGAVLSETQSFVMHQSLQSRPTTIVSAADRPAGATATAAVSSTTPVAVKQTLASIGSFISVAVHPVDNAEELPPPTVNATVNTEARINVRTQVAVTSDEQERLPLESMASAHYSDLGRFAGRYAVDPSEMENFVFDVSAENNELWLKPSYSPKRRLVQQSGTEFVDAASGPVRLSFNADTRGNVSSFTITGWGDEKTVQKIVLPSPSLEGNTTFRLSGFPNARIVALAGTFNAWNQSQFLFARVNGEWICRVNLPPGRYEYKFIVDGNWLVDPANPVTEYNARHFENSILTLE